MTGEESSRLSTCAAAGLQAPTRSLSGGNMQKLILGRALLAPQPREGKARPPRLIVGAPADLGPGHRRRGLRAAAAGLPRATPAPPCC